MLPIAAGAVGVIDVLIEGLGISNKTLNEKCRFALLAFGRRAAHLLQAVASNPETRAAHRCRLEEVVELMSDSEQDATQVGIRLNDALLDALRVTNRRLNEKAISAFAALPWRPINLLIAEAVNNQRRAAKYCARLLRAAGVVDEIPDVMQLIGLISLTSSKDITVRQLSFELMWKFRSQELNRQFDATRKTG